MSSAFIYKDWILTGMSQASPLPLKTGRRTALRGFNFLIFYGFCGRMCRTFKEKGIISLIIPSCQHNTHVLSIVASPVSIPFSIERQFPLSLKLLPLLLLRTFEAKEMPNKGIRHRSQFLPYSEYLSYLHIKGEKKTVWCVKLYLEFEKLTSTKW